MPGSRRQFWVVVGAAMIMGTLALTTAIVPDWIEFVFGWDPNHHGGSVERWSVIWLIVAGLYFVTVVLVAAATREWRRISAVGSSGTS
jgi:uncharacterized membrane protein YhaH (DUF805 family)